MKLDDDDFALFGLPRRFAVDPSMLDERRRALQSEVHPDRFASQGAAAQRIAAQWAMRVNEAHARLKDPLQRAAYLCELAGRPVDADSGRALPAAFLERQMALREALDEAKADADVARIVDEITLEERAMTASLQRRIDEEGDYAAAAAEAGALMFVARLREDADRRRQSLD